MGLIAKETGNGGGNFEPIEAGMHHAICYGIIDLGTTYDEKWKKTQHKILIQWEIPELRLEIQRDGQAVSVPRITSKKYTLSLHEKAGLRKDLESWRGRAFTKEELQGFDIHNLLGVNCLLNIVHQEGDNGKVYANIASIVPLMKNQTKVPAESELVFFSLADGDELPAGLGDWIVKIIMESEEWANRMAQGGGVPPQAGGNGIPDGMDDVPFAFMLAPLAAAGLAALSYLSPLIS